VTEVTYSADQMAHAEKHRRDVAAALEAEVRVDIARLDERQVLRLGQYCFGGPPIEDLGDSFLEERIDPDASPDNSESSYG
jgi:hypothetical protein